LKILILGYSKLVKKRIIDVLIKKKIFFSVASKSSKNNLKQAYSWYRNYDDALKNSRADLVYISLPNSLHYKWSRKALIKNYHVVVDKPLCENLSKTKKLLFLAKKKKRLLSEATFFNYHRQFNQALKLIGGTNKLIHVEANFKIPTPPKQNILMSKKLLGGVLMDMGPYAAAIPRLLFKEKAINIYKTIKKNSENLPISMELICKFKNKTYTGNFAFCNEYQNELFLYSKNKIAKIERVFSPPSNINLKLTFYNGKTYKKINIPKDNSFQNYLIEIKKIILKKNYNFSYKKILQDSKFREILSK
tara:strand:+ start:254 stop:1168 length:915 start_codon:yes stop_codon:yes gene_type:complete